MDDEVLFGVDEDDEVLFGVDEDEAAPASTAIVPAPNALAHAPQTEPDWRPFQRSVLNFLESPSDGRTIYWIWEEAGETGKSKVMVPWLEKNHDALMIDATATRDVLTAIKTRYDESGLFRAHPIVFLNIPYAKSFAATNSKMYTTLEGLQDSFLDTKTGRSHVWENSVFPHVVVTANVPPACDPPYIIGRLEVHHINEQYVLEKDTITQKKLDAHAETKRERRREYSKSLQEGAQTQRYLELGGAGAGGRGDTDAHHERVAALQRLFKRQEGSQRRLRHEVYAYIADNEPTAWARCGTDEQRQKALGKVCQGGRIHTDVVKPWDAAFEEAFERFKFHHQPYPCRAIPQGYSTTELINL